MRYACHTALEAAGHHMEDDIDYSNIDSIVRRVRSLEKSHSHVPEVVKNVEECIREAKKAFPNRNFSLPHMEDEAVKHCLAASHLPLNPHDTAVIQNHVSQALLVDPRHNPEEAMIPWRRIYHLAQQNAFHGDAHATAAWGQCAKTAEQWHNEIWAYEMYMRQNPGARVPLPLPEDLKSGSWWDWLQSKTGGGEQNPLFAHVPATAHQAHTIITATAQS